MEGKREEEKGRRERGRTDDGKWPPPRCHMGGGFERVKLVPLTLDASREQNRSFPFTCHVSVSLFFRLPFKVSLRLAL